MSKVKRGVRNLSDKIEKLFKEFQKPYYKMAFIIIVSGAAIIFSYHVGVLFGKVMSNLITLL